MTDQELKAKIDSLVRDDQPLTVAPLLEEARKRATKAKDTRWMFDVIKTDYNINARRNSRSGVGLVDALRKEAEKAWTPLRQLLMLEVLEHKSPTQADIDAALSDAKALRAAKTADCLSDVKGVSARLNMYDYVALTLAMRYPGPVAVPLRPTSKAGGNDGLEGFADVDYLALMEAEARKAGDAETELSLVLAQAIRVSRKADSGLEPSDGTVDECRTLIEDLRKRVGVCKDPMASVLLNFAEAEFALTRANFAETDAESDALTAESVSLFRKVADASGGDVFGSMAQTQIRGIESREFSLQVGGGTPRVVDATPMPVLMRYRNVTGVTLKTFRMQSDNLRIGDKNFSTLGDPVATAHFDLPSTRRRLLRSSAYAELDGLPVGSYVVVAYVDGDSKPLASYVVKVTRLGVTQLRLGSNSMYVVADAVSGVNAGATLKVESGDVKTDADGWFFFKDRKGSDVVVSKGADVQTVSAGGYYFSDRESSKSDLRAVVVLDRAVYRPGQVVMGKVYVFDSYTNRKEAVANADGTFIFHSSNGKTLSNIKFKTNKFGTASFEYKLPDDVTKGSASVQVSVASRSVAWQHFLIEDFKRTDNTIEFDPVTDVLLPGSTVRVSGHCKAASGLPVAGAVVKYSVSDLDEGGEGETVTDDEGAFSISFTSKDFKVDQHYYVNVSVTDNRGETTESGRSVNIIPRGTTLELTIAKNIDDSYLIAGSKVDVLLDSRTCNGADYKTRVHLKVMERECDMSLLPRVATGVADTSLCRTPHFQFRSVPDSDGRTVFEADYDVCGRAVVTLEGLRLDARRYVIEASTTAANGDTISSRDEALAIPSEGRGNQLYNLLMDVREGANLPGDTITLRVGSCFSDMNVWLVASRANKEVLRRQITLSGEVKKIDFMVPSDAIEGEDLIFHLFGWHNGEFYSVTHTCSLHEVPNEMVLTLKSFRDFTTPRAHETWTLNLGKDTQTEVLASMYDERLDAYADGTWRVRFPRRGVSNSFEVYSLRPRMSSVMLGSYHRLLDLVAVRADWHMPSLLRQMAYSEQMSDFLMRDMVYRKASLTGAVQSVGMNGVRMMSLVAEESVAFEECAMATAGMMVEDDMAEAPAPQAAAEAGAGATPEPDVPVREDFRETVFFLPHLHPDSNGDVTFSFDVPDNLTAYRFQAVAHDAAMRSAYVNQTVRVRKALNLRLGVPRFVTEGDRIVVSADVTATDPSLMTGSAKLSVSDAETGRLLMDEMPATLDLTKSRTQRVEWSLVVPRSVTSLRLKAVARMGDEQDGEQHDLPVELADIEVPESQTFFLFGKGEHDVPNPYTQGESHDMTFSYTSNVFTEVLRALPVLDSEWHPCVDTYLGHLETSSIALFLKQKQDIMKAVEYLSAHADDLSTITDADHTPWYRMAQRMKRHDKDVVRLMSGDYASKAQRTALRKLAKLQNHDGSFSWFEGMDGSAWLTAGVLSTIGEMVHLGAIKGDADDVSAIVNKGQRCLDREIAKRVAEIREANNGERALGFGDLEILYARLLFNVRQNDDVRFMLDVLRKHWQYDVMSERIQAIAVFTLVGDKDMAALILKSVEENLVQMDENRAYVAERGLWRRGAELTSQSLLIITLGRLNSESPNLLKLINHLICQKRGEAWGTNQVTSRAVLALLGSASSLAATDLVVVGQESVEASLANPKVSFSLDGKPVVSKAVVTKGGDTPTWGSWSRILHTPIVEMPADTSKALSVERTFEVRRGLGSSAKWKPLAEGADLKVGDRLRVSLKFYNDDPLSYVRLRDHRAAALEPVDKVSGYRGWWFWRWTNADIPTPPHFLSIGDETMEFFIDHLNDGWHSVSYEVVVTHAGRFTAGYADAQCMYEPDIKSHTAGCAIEVR